jgi:hypothetical protein
MGTSSRREWSARIAFAATTFAAAALFARNLTTPDASLPQGFEVSVYAEGVKHARGLSLAEDGTLFVGTPREGVMYAISAPIDGRKPTVSLLASDLHSPPVIAAADVSAKLHLEGATISDALDHAEQDLVDYAWNPATGELGLSGIDLAKAAAQQSSKVAAAPDGTFFIADSCKGVVYRIAWRPGRWRGS